MIADVAACLTVVVFSSASVEMCEGACVAVFDGLIGLGGAELHLPVLIAVFALYPHRSIQSADQSRHTCYVVARLSFLHSVNVADCKMKIAGMLGGIVVAWLGAGYLKRITKARIMGAVAVLLLATVPLFHRTRAQTAVL